MTICNMAIEAGGKNGIVAPDDKALTYVRERNRTRKPFEAFYTDPDAAVARDFHYNVGDFEPGVAQPSSPDRFARARDLNSVKLDRAYIGSCTGGKISDFLAAARILNGRRVTIPTFLVPATAEVAQGLQTERVGGKTLAAIFQEAGCLDIAPPSCAACLGGPDDTFGRTSGREVVISATNRNFIGRMGSKDAPIYLASPLTIAASAVAGRITDPREMMQ